MQTARRAKHAEDNGTPSERRVAAEDAGLRPLREVTRKTGPPLNDQMDTEDTSDDGVGARDARDDEGNAEWSLFTKRKPIRKVKPEQLRLERRYRRRQSAGLKKHKRASPNNLCY
ncbi:hypothetical protein HPB52_008454 [Rhipicephalus sanguineus]|uniref:Uncharacterized protein n=1 Tax=Rhipicephalus sanguineus TaxID=34632 RepID=A0A9D4PVB8_RHISA|nr:hypothetical protein HPB52_008454 [Rhipicephalus sanguineus]